MAEFGYEPLCGKKGNGRAKQVMESAVLPMIYARKRAGMNIRVTWHRLELCDEERYP